MDTKAFDREIDTGPAKVLIGHCRSKTSGAVSRSNAHPFNFDNVIGVHNGTLDYSWRREIDAKEFDVDSEWLFARIDSEGIEETIPAIDRRGAWALCYWNKDSSTLNFIRNSERTLHFCWNKAKDCMFWASEQWMLCAVSRLLDVAELDDKTGAWSMPLPEDTLWSFEVNKATTPVFTAKPSIELKGGDIPIVGFTQRSLGWNGAANAEEHGNHTTDDKGGSGVSSPFLDDELPDLTPEELGTTSAKSSKPKNSQQESSGSGKGKKQSTSGSKPKLSLVSSTSLSSPTGNKGKPSGVSEQSSQPSCSHSKPSKGHLDKQVSLRKVAGIWYISSKKDNTEISELEFEARTNGICGFCKEPIGGLEEIHTLVNRNKFICVNCVGS